MRHLAAAETDRGLDLVAVAQKLERAAQFEIIVMRADADGQTDFADFDNVLVFPCFAQLFGLLELELAVIHDFAHGRNSGRCDLYKVETGVLRRGLRHSIGDDTLLLAVLIDETDGRVADFRVDHMLVFRDGKHLQDFGSRWTPA